MGKLLELLNTAFELEYNDIFLYLKEAGLFQKKLVAGEKLAKIFEEFGRMELYHADRLAMKIIELGGKAQWNFRIIEPVRSVRETLRKHLEYETRAYHLYEEILELIEEPFGWNSGLKPEFKLVIKGIQSDEKEHLEKIVELLKKIK